MPVATASSGRGWLPDVQHSSSPNFDARPQGVCIDLLVLHNISLPPGGYEPEAIVALLTSRLDPDADPFFATLGGLRVSSHFLVDRQGLVTQLVSCDERAWHAGISQFEERTGCNDFSIGVELIGSDFVAFDPRQYAALARLTTALRRRYPLRAVRGHQHIAPDRKTDPGPFFDWSRLACDARLPSAMLPPGNFGPV